MPIQFLENEASFKAVCTVEEAEPLLQWLQNQPKGAVTLKECTHIHTAIVQVLMAGQVAVTLPPEDAELVRWLMPSLSRDT